MQNTPIVKKSLDKMAYLAYTPAMPDNTLTVKQAARILGYSPRQVLRWCTDGTLPNARKRNPLARNSPIFIPVSDVKKLQSTLELRALAEHG